MKTPEYNEAPAARDNLERERRLWLRSAKTIHPSSKSKKTRAKKTSEFPLLQNTMTLTAPVRTP
jgi:hypothetical protein